MSTRPSKADPSFGSEESGSRNDRPPLASRRGPKSKAPPWMAAGRGTHRPPRSLSGSAAQEADTKSKPPPAPGGRKSGSADADPLPSPVAWDPETADPRPSTAVSDEEFREELLGEEKTPSFGSEESGSRNDRPPLASRRGPKSKAPPWMAAGRGTHRPPHSLSGSAAQEADTKSKPPPAPGGRKSGSADADPLPSPVAWDPETADPRP
ncbi:MAG: hypothetical protein PHO89_00660, partial [Methylacidiphilaceae bacterium]|nr:hypothetical protein [Candidatus Methylacidiphilaceae bacterium]